MNNNLNFLFGMYEPATGSIIANIDENTILVIRCKECNSSVIFDDPNDVVYLYRLAMETPLLYAKFALKENGLIAKPTHDHIIRFTPPLVITKEQMTEAVDIIRETFALFT